LSLDRTGLGHSHFESGIGPDQEASLRPDTAAAEGRHAPAGVERRHLTVLFCDLVESTALGHRLDPEDFDELIAPYQAVCAEVIKRFHGHVAQFQGDGVLAYFGYPHAGGDDAVHAVRAGLELVRAVKGLADQDFGDGFSPASRVGIHTGTVVVRADGSAIGDTVNLASRLENAADVDTVVVSGITERLTRGYFEFARLAPARLKGIEEEVTVYRVVDETGIRTRLALAAAAGLTPLVGRESELAALEERWRLALEGQGQALLVTGEPGIGKSRLVHEVGRRVGEGASRLVFQASPYYASSALHPVVEELERVFRVDGEVGDGENLVRLADELASQGLPTAETVPLFASLLAIPLPDSDAVAETVPQEQKRRTLTALTDLLVAETMRRPVLAVFEDLHWADPSTLDLLDLVLAEAPARRLLVVMTARPEFEPPWSSSRELGTVTLARLDEPRVDELIAAVLGERHLPRAVLADVAARSEGVPFFVEETLKMILESGGSADAGSLAMPGTLQNPLAARLDGLEVSKELAQLASVAALGGEFSYALLQSVSHADEVALNQALDELVRTELLYERGTRPESVYVFKHALIREAAYESLLRSTRRSFHARIAQALEESLPDVAEGQPEVIAQHLTEAGRTLDAISYWQRSGERALRAWATEEAATHFGRGLELVAALPEDPGTKEVELGFQLALGTALMAARGYAAPEAEAAYARAEALSREVNDPARVGPALYGLAAFYTTTAQLDKSHDLSLRLLAVAQEAGDEDALLEANVLLGVVEFLRGRLRFAEQYLQAALTSWEPDRHRSHIFVYGQEPGVIALTMAALTSGWLGRVDEALRLAGDAQAAGREAGHPLTLAYTLAGVSILYQVLGEVERAEQTATELVDVSRDYKLPMWLAWARTLHGWALLERDQRERGLAEIAAGVAGAEIVRSAVMKIHFTSQLAEAFSKQGFARDGLDMLEQGFALLEPTGERVSEAELHRARGLIHLSVDDSAEEAEVCFRRGIEVAAGQGALLLELRSATALAELWTGQERSEEARALLDDLVGRFDGGYDTPVLGKARALLEEATA
jgi:class 3 adenylate cyclase/tetratricopeptide (TPR) repeat protein